MADHRGDVFTLEQAEEHIATVNGVVNYLTEYHKFEDSQVPNTPGSGSSGIYSVLGTLSAIRASGLTGGLPLTWADTGTQTVTAASATALSATYTIPANDANVGTVYRLTAWGNGTWGSTAQNLAFGIGFPSTTVFGSNSAIGAGFSNISLAFRWNCTLWVMCLQTGGSGSWNGSCRLDISQNPNAVVPGTAANNTTGAACGPSSNVTQDTTVDNALSMLGWWGSTTGAPTITCHGTFVERLGF